MLLANLTDYVADAYSCVRKAITFVRRSWLPTYEERVEEFGDFSIITEAIRLAHLLHVLQHRVNNQTTVTIDDKLLTAGSGEHPLLSSGGEE